MGKSKSKSPSHMPKAPWIYIVDSSDAHEHASKLASMIPNTIHLKLTQCPSKSPDMLADISDPQWHQTVVVLSRSKADVDQDRMSQSLDALKATSIKNGNNFASINIRASSQSTQSSSKISNHLDVEAALRSDNASLSSVKITAYAIYKWLFSAFTVLEQLHLIADRQMTAVDRSSAFKDYEYCPISDSRKYKKNAKIQFVALVMSKPEIGPNQRLHWQVADKTGVANFYFHYRGPSSQYTWDWVLALKPGDRKCLPRMPLVEVKERALTTILKSPLRASAALTTTTGKTLKLAGSSLCHIGSKLRLGERRTYIPEEEDRQVVNSANPADIDGGKISRRRNLPAGEYRSYPKGWTTDPWKNKSYGSLVPAEEKTEVWIFSEKGEKVWRDDDSIASTEAGSL